MDWVRSSRRRDGHRWWYLLLNQVTVTSGFWILWGFNGFGLSLVPLLIGIGILFFNGKSPVGWMLTAGAGR